MKNEVGRKLLVRINYVIYMFKNIIISLAIISSLFIATPITTHAYSCPDYNTLYQKIGYINTPEYYYNWNLATNVYISSYGGKTFWYNMNRYNYNDVVYCLTARYGVGNIDYVYSGWSLERARFQIDYNVRTLNRF